MKSLQGKAAKVITGAYRATSYPALDVEAALLPMDLTLDRLVAESALRIKTSPVYSEITQPREFFDGRRRRKKKSRKISPLETLTDVLEAEYGPTGKLR